MNRVEKKDPGNLNARFRSKGFCKRVKGTYIVFSEFSKGRLFLFEENTEEGDRKGQWRFLDKETETRLNSVTTRPREFECGRKIPSSHRIYKRRYIVSV